MKYARPTSYTGQKATTNITGDIRLPATVSIAKTQARLVLSNNIFNGSAILIAGTVTIPLPQISEDDVVILSRSGDQTSPALGILNSLVAPGIGFTVQSLGPMGSTTAGEGANIANSDGTPGNITILATDVSKFNWTVLKNG